MSLSIFPKPRYIGTGKKPMLWISLPYDFPKLLNQNTPQKWMSKSTDFALSQRELHYEALKAHSLSFGRTTINLAIPLPYRYCPLNFYHCIVQRRIWGLKYSFHHDTTYLWPHLNKRGVQLIILKFPIAFLWGAHVCSSQSLCIQPCIPHESLGKLVGFDPRSKS